MSTPQFKDLALSTLAASLADTDTSFSVASGEGANFPALSAGQHFDIRVSTSNFSKWETMRVTAKSTDLFTVTRCLDSSTGAAQEFDAGAQVAHVLTATALDELQSLVDGKAEAGHAHNDLASRGVSDCHPQEAITDLVTALAGKLAAEDNLSDLTSASTARTNLELGTAAMAALASLLQAANNLSELTNAATARSNLGLLTTEVAYRLASSTLFNGKHFGAFMLVFRNNAGTLEHKVLSPVGYSTPYYDDSFDNFSATFAATPTVGAGVDFVNGVGISSDDSIVVFDQIGDAVGDDIIIGKVIGSTDCLSSGQLIVHGRTLTSDVNGTTKNRAALQLFAHAGDGTKFSVNTTNIAVGKYLYLIVLAITE